MALEIIVEDGTPLENSNSYASLADANAYAESNLYASAWASTSNDRKIVSLVQATRWLDASVSWIGRRLTAEQALAWPRLGAVRDSVEFAPNSIPRGVKNATCELARLLLAADLTLDPQVNNLKALNLGKGALEIDFKDASNTKRIPSIVVELLEGLGTIGEDGSASGFSQGRVSR